MVGDVGETSVVVVGRSVADGRSVAKALPVPDGAVRIHTDVESGVQAVTTDDPACVVAGHHPDDLDGLELLEGIRSVDPDVPVVLFPEDGDEATASAALAAGVTDYVPRKTDGGPRGGLDDLADAVGACLGDGRRVPGDRPTGSADSRSHRLIERATDEAPVGITITTSDGDDNPLVYANDRFEEMTGYEWSDIEGRDCRFLQGPETAAEPVAELGRAVDEERSTTVVLRNYRADGTEFWNRVTIAPVEKEDGVVDHFVGFQEDVTERKRRQRELTESERRFQAVFDDPNILVALLDPEGRIVELNRTVLEFVDANPGELAGEPLPETPWFADDDRRKAEVRDLIERAAAGEYAAFEFDLRDAVPDGLVVSGVIRPVTDADGTVVSLLISAQDVTERERRDQQLDALDRVLRHNLHNELNVVLGNAESIVELDDEAAADHAAEILESGHNLLDLTTKQRRIVRLLSDQPDLTTVDVAETVRDCVEDLDELYPDADVDVSLPEADQVLCRAISHIGRALAELVENAILHGESGPVRVRVATDDETVTVRVEDSGPGIPEEERAILLGEGERGPLYHGNGMGLWLVNWIVTYSDGRVAYEPNDPEGCVVSVVLQRADAGDAA